MRRASIAFLLLLSSLAIGQTHAESGPFSALYSHQALSLTIPYQAARSGNAELKVEVLTPEDTVLGQATQTMPVSQGHGVWLQEIALRQPMPLDEVIWQRVRFTLRYADEHTPAIEVIRSVSAILRRPVLHVLAQRSYIAGAQAAMRVIVSSPAGEQDESAPAASGKVRIELLNTNHEPHLLFQGSLDHRGSTEASFHFPRGFTGSFPVRFTAETALGTVETTENIQIEDQLSILLTSEKPIYQPSQTIHLRALALNRADQHAAGNRLLTFDVEDSRGNKVFRKAATTDAFGIASAEFTLADEVNLGAYHVRARIGDPEASHNTAEITVNVQRYVLPKFRVAVEFDEKGGKPRDDYRPGDHVTGTVRANYFFGKAVNDAKVILKASAMDVELFEAATAEGRTDGSGAYRFDLTLPRFLAGRDASHGSVPVVVEATIKDAADHAETRGEPITVSQSPLLIMAVPEGGKLARGIANDVYLLASYPDGSPAKASLRVKAGKTRKKMTTDEAGIATMQLPATETSGSLEIEADDKRGNRVSTNVHLESRDGGDQVLLRTSRAVYKPGDRIDLKVLSTRQRGAAYVDLVRDGQTILTRDVDLENGHAELSLTATPQMCGTLIMDAYVFGANSRPAADQRLLFVQPADELHIKATADAASYLPGSEAQVNFHVTNQHGEGVRAALGLEVVDQAVFALAERQPGFAKVFFYLEQELLRPHYEIHSLSSDEIVEPRQGEEPDQRDQVARVLFSAAESIDPHTLDDEVGRSMPKTAAGEYHARYREAFANQVGDLLTKLGKLPRGTNIADRFKKITDDQGRRPRDAWGTELRLEPASWWGRGERYYQVRSAGPDREFNTDDDLTVTITSRPASVYAPQTERTISLRMEHDRGPQNGLAEITGLVTDVTGAVIAGARIHLQKGEDRVVREAVADGLGAFTFPALAPGQYRLRIESPGFQSSARSFSLAARDRAVLSAQLSVGASTQTVMVTADPMMLQTENAMVAPAPMARPMAMAGLAIAGRNMGLLAKAKAEPQDAKGGAEPDQDAHVRSYFPEALYINPEILTNGSGEASIRIPLADSITTWRMAMFASTQNGALGTGTSEIKVFQDFFIDLDLPVTLTQGDRVTIPVAVYNYSAHRGDVQLKLKPEEWFALQDDEDKAVAVDPGQVSGAQFTIEAKQIGKYKLTLSGRMAGDAGRQDTVVREIEVVPNGHAKEIVFNGRLDKSESHTVRFPAGAIPDASKIFVRLYPGPLSQIVEGMDGILQMPYGCFEQTSSSTYPNVLALDYMKQTKKLTPEIRANAEGFIATGYQRLLTFEVPGGGFSWFGRAPANKILTAYGLMEFHDMARVYDVDPHLIERTRDWLVSQQQPDGSWKPDTEFINEGATDRYNSDLLRISAYIAWALETAEYKGPALENARNFIEKHLGDKVDAYTLAVLANFAVASDAHSDLTRRVLSRLHDAVTEKGEFAWWSAEETGVYSTGESAAVETTGLAVQVLLQAGQYRELARKALAWIASKKSGGGNWSTTQATIMALRALVQAAGRSGSDAHGTVEVLLNGTEVDSLTLTNDNNDLLHQFVLPGVTGEGDNQVELHFDGDGMVAYQVAGRYFVPWGDQVEVEPLSIEVKYDRTRLAQDEVVSARATMRNNTGKTAKMVMVDLGIPPGFELLSEDLQSMVEKTAGARSGRLEKFSLTATQAILYFDAIGPRDPVEVRFQLRAKYPVRAANFASRVYEYYDPAVSATARPAHFEVTAR
jgi:uncharacterized protein YfaS (alpha-2-macroglobulin family)